LLAVRQAVGTGRSDTQRSIAYVAYGLTLAAIMLAVCILIRPESLRVDYGLSYLGVFTNTIVPYAVALLGVADCTWRASELVTDLDHSLIIGRSMKIMVVQVTESSKEHRRPVVEHDEYTAAIAFTFARVGSTTAHRAGWAGTQLCKTMILSS